MTENFIEMGKNAILFASKASQLITDQRLEEALNLCEAGVRQFPFYSPGHYILGLCYEAMDKPEDARHEFERTLVYDPSHNKAMRKLSEFYNRSGLEQLANELLIREALYSPLNPEIIDILKEKRLYEKLDLSNGSSGQEKTEEETTEVELETDVQFSNSGVESIEEIDEPDTEAETSSDEATETEPEEEIGPIDNLDPLADEDTEEEKNDKDFSDVTEFNNPIVSKNPQETEVDFAPLMEGYFEREEDEDEDQWMEVENLLDEEDVAKTDLDPVPDAPKDETEMLLEKLSKDDDDIDLEAAVADPYDQIDLTRDSRKSTIEADELDDIDLQAAVNDPYGQTEVSEKNQIEKSDNISEQSESSDYKESTPETEESTMETEEQVTEEIVTPAKEQHDSFLEEENLETDSHVNIQEEENTVVSESTEKELTDETEQRPIENMNSENQETEEVANTADEEVTINDMLENPNLVTPTFGEILIAQHKFSEARHVFKELLKKEPENTRFIKKIQFLDRFLQAEGSV